MKSEFLPNMKWLRNKTNWKEKLLFRSPSFLMGHTAKSSQIALHEIGLGRLSENSVNLTENLKTEPNPTIRNFQKPKPNR